MENEKKFYSQKAIGIATYFGGPLAAGYLMKKNYEKLGEEGNAKKALVIGIISTVFLLFCIFLIPEDFNSKIANFIIPAIYTAIIYLIVEKKLGKILRKHKESGGEFYSGWNAALVGFISSVIIIVGVVVSGFIAGDFANVESDFNTQKYQQQISKFVSNEEKALKVFNLLNSNDIEKISEELNKGIVLWKENKKIISSIDSIQNLPKEIHVQNSNLLVYCELRIKHHNIMLKALSENTDKYTAEIEKVGHEINQIIEQLNKN